jgi:predicted small secreted protein
MKHASTRPLARTHRLGAALLASVLLAGSAIVLGACNTTAGAGQDVAATGNAVTTAADKTKAALP